jgi:uncharacterized cupin superfamily protein
LSGSDRWFVVNVADAAATESERFGISTRFGEPAGRFPEFGINLRLLQPGQPCALYHRENAQEAYLVLSGECTLIVDDEERPLRKGDFVHLPAGTDHILIGAGDAPSSVLMVGTLKDPPEPFYPRSEAAARYGASAEQDTSDPKQAYGPNPIKPAELGLPW